MTSSNECRIGQGGLKYNPPGTYISRAGHGNLNVKFRSVNRGAWDWRVCDLTTATSMDKFVDRDGDKVFAEPGGFEADPCLQQPLDDFVTNTDWFSSKYGNGYGRMEVIGHLGAQRPKSGCSPAKSWHCEAKAFDLAWITWSGGIHSRPCNGPDEVKDLTQLRRLVAVEAGLRKRFGYVLNRYIGTLDSDDEQAAEGPSSPHSNHFHVDNSNEIGPKVDRTKLDSPVRPARRRQRSSHYFIQDCVSAFTDVQPDYDARWGKTTEEGYLTLLSDLGMERLDPIGVITHFQIFLSFIMMHGFADARAGTFRWHAVSSLAGA